MADEKYHVAAVDCGMKQNIVRNLNQRGCSVTVFLWITSVREVEKLRPDGIFLSIGPGNPADVQTVVTW